MYSLTSPEGRLALSPLVSSGFFGVLVGIKGDLEWVHDRLRIGNYRAVSEGPCALCPANGSSMHWKDLRQHDACWLPFVHTADAGLAANPTRIDLFRLPGVQYYFGSVLLPT